MPFGILDTSFIDFPQGVDPAYLAGLRTRAGVEFPRVLRELDDRLAALNNAVDPLVAALVVPTTEQFVDGTGPSAFQVTRRSQYTLPRPQMAEGQATMLPIHDNDVSLEFTEDGLEAMSLRQVLNNVDSVVEGYRRRYRLDSLGRLFSDAEERFDPKTAAVAPGFAGSGTGTNVFTRPYSDGTALPSGYTHYYRDTAANRAAVITSALARLKKWNPGPFDLIASQAETDAIAALPAFVDAGSALIRAAQGTAEALVDTETYIGVYAKEIRVRKALNETTSPNIAIFKTFGAFNPRNPLAWRYDEAKGREAYVRYRSLYPLDQAVALQRFGIGVNNRVAAALIRIDAAGGYVAPTFV